MLDALGEKVAEVHRCCLDDRVTNLSTLEKLASIENHLSLLLQSLESIPEESLEMMKKIKDSERRSRYVSVTWFRLFSSYWKKDRCFPKEHVTGYESLFSSCCRQREEKLREQREKQKERMKRYLERSLADSKKIVSHLLNCFLWVFCVTTVRQSCHTSKCNISKSLLHLFGWHCSPSCVLSTVSAKAFNSRNFFVPFLKRVLGRFMGNVVLIWSNTNNTKQKHTPLVIL